MTGYTVSPLSSVLGAQISGVDLRREVSPAQVTALRRLMRSHFLLVFPDQRLEPEDQVRVVSLFGPVVGPRSSGPMYSLVDVEEGDVVQFHSDYSFTRAPLPYVSLYGVEVEGDVATTAFVNAITACAQLPVSLLDRITDRTALHASDILAVGQRSAGSLRNDFAQHSSSTFRSTHHPVILRHPETGEPILFVNSNLSVAIDGLPDDESADLLQALFAHLYAPERIYNHRWREGDLLIFDNIALQHSRSSGPRRTLRRVIVSGEPLAALLSWSNP